MVYKSVGLRHSSVYPRLRQCFSCLWSHRQSWVALAVIYPRAWTFLNAFKNALVWSIRHKGVLCYIFWIDLGVLRWHLRILRYHFRILRLRTLLPSFEALFAFLHFRWWNIILCTCLTLLPLYLGLELSLHRLKSFIFLLLLHEIWFLLLFDSRYFVLNFYFVNDETVVNGFIMVKQGDEVAFVIVGYSGG